MHPNISAHGEMFLKSLSREDCYAYFRKRNMLNRVRHYMNKNKSIEEYLRFLYQPKDNIESIGFKLMYNQTNCDIEKWIKRNKIHVIHLIRKNVLKTILSRDTAQKRQLYHTANKKIEDVKVSLDPERLIGRISRILSDVKKHKKKYANQPYLEISYEEFVSKKELTTKKMHDFLKVRNIHSIEMPLNKINPDSPKQLIKNYQEVVKLLKNTTYKKYLDETLN